MEKMYVLYLKRDLCEDITVNIIAVSSSIEALRHKVYDWFRYYRFNIPDDDEAAEKWLEENEGIGGWWDDTRTNFHFNDDESDFWIEEVEFLK